MQTIGFVGAGRMAQALAGGIAQANPAIGFVIVDPNPESQNAFRRRVFEAHQVARKRLGVALPDDQTGSPHHLVTSSEPGSSVVTCVQDSQQVFDACHTILLAVKPQLAATALSNLTDSDPFSKLIVSVMAGITTEKIQSLTHQRKIIRVMPNTPCLIGLGASAMACTEAVSTEEAELVLRFFESVGIVERVDESLLNAVTGLSGSGPAYVFAFIESLIRGGVAAGLAPKIADRLARQTVLGAVTMLNRLDASPAELRSQVTSPGGTTLAGLERLEKLGFDEAIIQAIVKATERSGELGRS